MKTMTIDGVEYVEAPDTKQCVGCAFIPREDLCDAIAEKATDTFGGACASRRVIYIRATPDDRETAVRRMLDEGVM